MFSQHSLKSMKLTAAKKFPIQNMLPLPPARGKAGMGVCKHTVFSITPILTFPLAGGRSASFECAGFDIKFKSRINEPQR